jgi:hypothetical protein
MCVSVLGQLDPHTPTALTTTRAQDTRNQWHTREQAHTVEHTAAYTAAYTVAQPAHLRLIPQCLPHTALVQIHCRLLSMRHGLGLGLKYPKQLRIARPLQASTCTRHRRQAYQHADTARVPTPHPPMPPTYCAGPGSLQASLARPHPVLHPKQTPNHLPHTAATHSQPPLLPACCCLLQQQ